MKSKKKNPGRRKKRKEGEAEAILERHFLKKNIERQYVIGSSRARKITPRYITVKLKIKDKEKIPKAARDKSQLLSRDSNKTDT